MVMYIIELKMEKLKGLTYTLKATFGSDGGFLMKSMTSNMIKSKV